MSSTPPAPPAPRRASWSDTRARRPRRLDARRLRARPGRPVVQFASLGFDTHAEEIWPALAAGATVVLLPDGALSLPDSWHPGRPASPCSTCRPRTGTTWSTNRRGRLAGRRCGWSSSAASRSHAAAVARWRDRFGDRVRLVNTYGPTEATIIATAADLGRDDTAGRTADRRARPAAPAVRSTPARRPVPPGAPGELCIGGAGLARGYLGRPDLTAERFVRPGRRRAGCYRTGDRARLPAGRALEFLGRLDDQVKVRGFRIEPGEVEAACPRSPGVRQAVVAAHDETLVGYVAGRPRGRAPRPRSRSGCPRTWCPARWVALDALPLTANGKLDRRRLPLPAPGRDGGPSVAPRTDAEQLVAEVWAEVLGVGQGRRARRLLRPRRALAARRPGGRPAARDRPASTCPIRLLFTHRRRGRPGAPARRAAAARGSGRTRPTTRWRRPAGQRRRR